MPAIPTKKLIQDFYLKNKEEFNKKNLKLDEVYNIILYPWKDLSNAILNGETRSFRFHFFGIFETRPNIVKKMLMNAYYRFERGSIDREKLNRYIKKYEKHEGMELFNRELEAKNIQL